MIRGFAFVIVFLGAAALNSTEVAAIKCLVGSIQETTAPMDAIFVGTIAEVRQVRLPGPEKICASEPEFRLCQAAIATVNVEKVWKGAPGITTTVLSYDGVRGDYRREFRVGKRMLFVLVQDANQTAWEFRPAICGTTVGEQEAESAGVIDDLDTLQVQTD